MIYQVSGDILLSQAQVIAHGIAANDPMSQGLALSLHRKYPAMHKDFHHWCHQSHPKAGTAWLWGGADSVRVVNLITQEGGFGKGARPGKATLKHVRDSLKALKKIIQKENFKSVALPKLATGVGGLIWDDVLPVIEGVLGEMDIPVYLYTDYHAGKQASEVNLT
ncbi:macro domain-containing protein [Exilibacterium tricleocarpae]|uniref:Macro domain-containing protein n=1 Tax=Exilibacterium tricleocarpae TaxID=2591008 RepID=A0A545ST72_9GAMM|nr:macro domain-containing protein [Exilibacterium tricleocarpae]TQV68168.1 macro domain-containing protein [Exilibacterium tricleocarpae]